MRGGRSIALCLLALLVAACGPITIAALVLPDDDGAVPDLIWDHGTWGNGTWGP
jgi:hypothetical protein